MNSDPVLAFVQQRTGMDPAALGPTLVESAIQKRLRALSLPNSGAYAARLVLDPVEYQLLLSELVVPETWFFRGGELFYYLAEYVRAVLAARRTSANPEPFRILSLPCSTGEEPYSLAMALAELAVPFSSCFLLAVDICDRSIEEAKKGIYGELSFRQFPENLRNRYFRPVVETPQKEKKWEVDLTLRTFVRFQTGNLLDEYCLSQERPFDLVFCRNLFIYLTPQARLRAENRLMQLLHPDGLLCLGHADVLAGTSALSPEGKNPRLERFGPTNYFIHRRAKRSDITPAVISMPGRALLPEKPGPAIAVLPKSLAMPTPTPSIPPQKQAETVPVSEIDLLACARSKANQGLYRESLELCKVLCERRGPTAEIYTLMGITQQASDCVEEAETSFIRALYLDPYHREALVHLMLLYQMRGDVRRADLLRSRINRLPDEGDET